MTSPTFQPAWWCTNTHAQTVAGALLRRRPQLNIDRQRWDTPDGDFLDLDCLAGPDHSPRLLLLHGLEGSSESPDIRHLMAAAHQLGWECIGMNFRTCSGETNRLERAYHAGETSDLAWVIEQLVQAAPERPIVCAGVSLGGNVLLKYLGESGASLPAQVRGAVTISTPFDLVRSVAYVEQGLSMIYIRRFVNSLKRKMFQKLERYPDLIDREMLASIQTLSEFDEWVTAPLHGFPDAKTYWTVNSSIRFLSDIQRPTLLINAQDDPFYPADILPRKQVADNPYLSALFPERGGHGAFIEGGYPFRLRSWSQAQTLAFLQQQLAT